MAERRYSVSEIHQMRATIRAMLVIWRGWLNDHSELVEDRLRTYMLNGTEPEELETALAEEPARRAEFWRQVQAIQHCTDNAAHY